MSAHYFIGMDIHKKMIAYCVKTVDGRLVDQGMVNADRKSGSSSFCVDLIFRGIKPTQNDKNNNKTVRWFKMAANIAKRPIPQEAALCALQEQRDR